MYNKKEKTITGFNSIQGESKFETINLFQKDLTPALELTSQGINHPLLDFIWTIVSTLTIILPIYILLALVIFVIKDHREEKRSGGPQFRKIREYF